MPTGLALTLIGLLPAVALTQGQVPPDQGRQQAQAGDQDIYGWQLMTPAERAEHRAKMRAAKTDAERDKIRKEHHDKMKARAKERGVTLPEEPPTRGGAGSGDSSSPYY
jgi:hypothetical protein